MIYFDSFLFFLSFFPPDFSERGLEQSFITNRGISELQVRALSAIHPLEKREGGEREISNDGTLPYRSGSSSAPCQPRVELHQCAARGLFQSKV